MRIAKSGQGKSGGFRTLVLYRIARRAFFVYGYAKNDRKSIGEDERAILKKAAGHVLELSDAHLAELVSKGQFLEVCNHDEEISQRRTRFDS